MGWLMGLEPTTTRSLTALPPRKETPFVLAPELVDRALDIAHRRGRLDTIGQRLLIPAAAIPRIFEAEFKLRELAGYGVRETHWAPTALDRPTSHSRSSTRPPAETRRVVPFLRSLEPKLVDPAFLELMHKACAIWVERYRSDSTPLILGSPDEIACIATFALAAGIADTSLEVRVPDDGLERGQVLAALAPHGLSGAVVRATGSLAFARSSHAWLGQRRAGLMLRENRLGPLTSMVQFHRSLHVLCTWLSTQQT